MEPAHNNEAPQTEKRKLREPERPEVNVSSKKDPKSYKIIVKLILRKFGYCFLRSLGNASESVVQIAANLKRSEIASIEKIESGITELDDVNNETGTRHGITFTVKLVKGAKFDEMTQNLE